MTTLEGYLTGNYRGDRQEIESLTRTLEQAAATFTTTFAGEGWAYRYEVDTTPVAPDHVSQGTLAMTLCAVGKLLGTCKFEGRTDIVENGELSKHWREALKALTDDIQELKPSYDGADDCHFRSSTFGNDNAMTLSHVAELWAGLSSDQDLEKKVFTQLEASVKKIKILIADPAGEILFPKNGGGEYRPSAFVLLRALRACRDVGIKPLLPPLRKFFESGLHDQLSFSAIPDSRFDPAELLFCLEGLLLCAPEAVDGASFQRVLEVLADKQNTSAHWRPNKPFVASDTGVIMLPLSIECANSLMRSITVMDRDRTHDLFAAKSLPLLHRFWNWLEARSVGFDKDGLSCVGWHSEHVNEPNLIHIWDTSQVVEFMIAYRALLYGHVARMTLDLSGVKERRPKPLRETLSPMMDDDGKEIENARYQWSDVVDEREPLKNETGLQIYSFVGDHFVTPHSKKSAAKPSYSMLLYGPPGTGKSTLAELMADALGWSMLTVTVSDFLGSGGAMVEARAKAIFQMLEAQSQVIILFDEIDAFLLDRDSKFYRDQETLFKFLTPGMLTKINDLRKAERSIFIVATNYANRIDPAIKRVGRIDHKLLLLPPNKARREKMIAAAWPDGSRKGENKIDVRGAGEVGKLADAFLYLGWNDIKGFVKSEIAADYDIDTLILKVKDIDRSTGPEFYGRRFPEEGPFKDQILDEIRWLYSLAKESEAAADFKDTFLKAADEATPDKAKVSVASTAETLLAGFHSPAASTV